MSPTAAGQTPPPSDAYLAAVRAYADTGNPGAAVSGLKGWSKARFESAINGHIKGNDQRLIEAATILHLEIGLGVVQLSPAGAMGYFELGQILLNNLSSSADAVTMRANWHSVAASALLMMDDAGRARVWVERGLRIAPTSAALLTLSGLVSEVQASGRDPRFFDPGARGSRAAREYRALLSTAQGRYRSALQVDRGFVQAQIRLGRVSWLLGRTPEARPILEKALAGASQPGDVYQAALFLADIQRQEKDLAGARASYERALAVRPTGQIATVGLGYLELTTGRPDRAQALARSFAAASATDHDWWTQRNGGVDQAALTWLRQRVRR